jgi:hypothetical protein
MMNEIAVRRVDPTSRLDLISQMLGTNVVTRYAEMMDICWKLSGEVWSGYVDDELICCWGLIPPSVFSTTAYLWMWHSEKVVEHQFVFIRRSQIEVGRMLERYASITGHAEIGNARGIRWLRWLGAVFDAPDGPLLPFVIRRTDGRPN